MRKVSSIGWVVLMGLLVGGCGEKPSEAARDSRSAAASTPDPAPAADSQSENVQVFWQDFRRAVLTDDRAALLSKDRRAVVLGFGVRRGISRRAATRRNLSDQ